MKDKIINILKNKHIAILGYGMEGKATYDFLEKYIPEAKITILDKKDVLTDNQYLKSNPNVDYVFGDHYLDDLDKYDLIMKTPGISLLGIDTSSFINKISSQVELFLEVNRENVIGITGTKGKSTTSSLIYKILQENGVKSILAGNIGKPVFSFLDDEYKDYLFVLELSSHQLEYLKVSPHISLILNLYQDHLDHAGSVLSYYNAKMNIVKYQEENDYMLYSIDNDNLNNMINNTSLKSKQITVSINKKADICLRDDTVYSNENVVFDKNIPRNILGIHNFVNIMFAYKVSELLKLDKEKTIKAIKSFKGLDYRMQKIGTINNVDYYVDTLATIPEATMEALNSLENINTLIFGGMDRGISYDGFAEYLTNTKIEHFICMPTTGHIIGKLLPKGRTFLVNDLKEACDLAKKITKPNTICILSPAAASYEYFKNYKEKADKFKEYIFDKESTNIN